MQGEAKTFQRRRMSCAVIYIRRPIRAHALQFQYVPPELFASHLVPALSPRALRYLCLGSCARARALFISATFVFSRLHSLELYVCSARFLHTCRSCPMTLDEMLGATRKISFLPAVLLILLSGVFLFASAMPMSSTEESTIEALRLRGVSEVSTYLTTLVLTCYPPTPNPNTSIARSHSPSTTRLLSLKRRPTHRNKSNS